MKRAAAVRVMMSVVVLCGTAMMSVGCGANGTGGASDPLVEQVDRAALGSQLLYWDPVVSGRPLTAEQMGDTTGAVPVRVEVLDTVAVAWLAPNGVPQYDNAGIIAVFPVSSSPDGFTDITPINDTTHAVPTIPRATGPGGLSGPGGVTTSTGTVANHDVALPGITSDLTSTFLKWQSLISMNPSIVRQIGGYHPGCG